MDANKKTIAVISITGIFALGVGIAIGASMGSKVFGMAKTVNDNNNAIPVPADLNLPSKSVDELSVQLSEVLLPEDESSKINQAILQTAQSLLMAQAQQASVTVTDEMQQELKKSIEDKYSRKYFANLNASSMKELSKEELISILSFYSTDAGKKFLKLSPKIIQTTMASVQSDLSAWLPQTVTALVDKVKSGNKGDKKDEPKNDIKEDEKAKDSGANS